MATDNPVNYSEVFEDVLERGERLVWTGRPRQDSMMPLNPKSTLITGVAALFSLMFAVLAGLLVYNTLYRVIGAVLGLIFCIVCAYATFNQVGGGFLARKKAYYALTNRRALALFLHRVPALVAVDVSNPVRLRMSSGERGTIYFGEGVMTYVGMEHVRGGKRLFDLAFEDIEDARQVYDLICRQNPERRGPPVA
ncbi:hypothetical protein [Methanocella sp. MCL-LM]|uniref:hypothetical protein n=1 Tax=Methanocella sp. MCL-LM TaxID=3412035 RepID=UPI003C70F25C